MVRTLQNVGPYEGLGVAYEAITEWISAHDAEVVGPVRERYLNGPGEVAAPADYRTELEMPIVDKRLPVLA